MDRLGSYKCLGLVEDRRSRMICRAPMLDCPLNGQFGVLGRKWTLSILRDIGFRGIGRFKELNESIGHVTPRILSLRLRQLEREGLIGRKRSPIPGNAPVWQLTEKGAELIPLLLQWASFRSKWDATLLFRDGQPRTLQEISQADDWRKSYKLKPPEKTLTP